MLFFYIGWDYNREEIEIIFNVGIVYGVWNEKEELIVSVVIILYGEKLVFIGMVIVYLDYKGRGIGKIIMEVCVKSVLVYILIMFIVMDEGKFLYEKLGFRVVSYVFKYICNLYNVKYYCVRNEDYVMNYEEGDLEKIIKIDEYVFGINRKEFLKKRIM